MTPWLLLLLGVLLTLGTALFVAAEFSLVALDRPTVQRAVDGDSGRSRCSSPSPPLHPARCVPGRHHDHDPRPRLRRQPRDRRAHHPLLEAAGLGPRGRRTPRASSRCSSRRASMIVGEMVPKTLAVSAPLGTAKVVATPMRVIATLLRPMLFVLNGSANWVLHRLGIEPQEELSAARSPPSSPRSCAPPSRPARSTPAPPVSSRARSASASRPPRTS
ncbi:CNNM domain-containing protein [Janibacter melonis]|uniref:CNNM domain-containing protein n=1 Tax=Janibacter melonis TaxID=262209 RepID=UPI0027DA93ED|nr:CNNM domain-containing protein [Janibacter melonis]